MIKTRKINNISKPKVLFIGNGIFRQDNSEWKKVIEKYTGSNDICNYTNVPNTILTLITSDNKKHKNKILEAFKDYKYIQNEELSKLIKENNFDAILTTNYTYDIERLLLNDYELIKNKRKYVKSTSETIDKKYLIHTYNKIHFNNKDIDIWHIHGELRNTNSIILSHDSYGGLTRKIIDHYNKKVKKYKDGNNVLVESWIDYYMLADVYFIGFGFDFSEFDLWWLLSKRKHLKAKGKFIIYNPSSTNDNKKEVLKKIDDSIIYRDLGFVDIDSKQYNNFYLSVIRDIGKELNKKSKTASF